MVRAGLALSLVSAFYRLLHSSLDVRIDYMLFYKISCKGWLSYRDHHLRAYDPNYILDTSEAGQIGI